MDPRLAELREQAGRHLAAGEIEAARTACNAILALSADDSLAYLMLSECAAAQDRQRQACDLALAAAKSLGPAPAEQRQHLAMRLFAVGEYEAASQLVLATDFRDPKFRPLLLNFSQQLRLLELHDQSLALLDAAIASGAAGPAAQFLRGNALKFLGRMELAAEAYESCLAKIPGHSGAHWALASLGLEANASLRISRIQRLLQQGGLSPTDEIYLAYALFRELDGQDETEPAWQALQAGARRKRAQLRYDPAEEARLLERLRTATTGDWPSDGAVGDRTPIFILGMPRTGTTLLERILGRHPQVRDCGELNDFRMQFKWASDHYCHGFIDPAGVASIASLNWGELGQRYLSHTRWRVPTGSHFTDKNPGNFLLAGLIARSLPGAKIIHVRRNPMDTCFSNLKELFGGNAYAYSYDLSELAGHHRNYRELMEHWHRLAPGRILDIHYEDLVTDPESTARKVMAHCGLGYDAAQIASQDHASPVSSASSAQVRRPIHAGNVQGWRRYAAQLAPLESMLRAQGSI